jgi:hypothetical protein
MPTRDGPMAARRFWDADTPQREAAVFYGLFLRGHSVETLREDIDVPDKLLKKWMKSPIFEAPFRETLRRLYYRRKQVLAIFDQLISNENTRLRLQ